MRLSNCLAVVAALYASGLVTSPSYADCINGSRQCLTHIVYVCQNGWWVVTQGACHHADDPGYDKSALLFNRVKMNVNYSKPADVIK